MPPKKNSPLKLLSQPPRTLRDKLRTALRARLQADEHAPPDRDLEAVLDACRDPELTRKMADVARNHAQRNGEPSKVWDRFIDWLDTWDGSPDTAAKVAEQLVGDIGMQCDPETGTGYVPTCSAEIMANVRWELLRKEDGESRLRRILGILWNDSVKAERALKYRTQRRLRSKS